MSKETVDNKQDKPFEVRFYLSAEFSKAVRAGQDVPALEPLKEVLAKHNVGLHNQLDEFEGFLTKVSAIKDWNKEVPNPDHQKFLKEMQAITEKTLAVPEKREYLSREFTVELPKGTPAYKGNEADALISDLQALDAQGVFAEGPRETEKGVRKVYRPKRHPGTTGHNPDILDRF